MSSMHNFSLILSCVGLMIALLAFACSCVAISFIVGLRNSTHRIEWKTYDPDKDSAVQEEEEEVQPEMEEANPNKRIKSNPPFTPFAPEPKVEEPFFDEEDPNNISHDY